MPQPVLRPSPVEITNRGHRLARGLALYVPARLDYVRNLADRRKTAAGATTSAATPWGRGILVDSDSAAPNFSTYAPIVSSDGSGTGDFTIACIANPASSSTGAWMLRQEYTGQDVAFLCGRTYANANSAGVFSVAVGLSVGATSDAAAVDDKYHLFVGVRRNTVFDVYVDGIRRTASQSNSANSFFSGSSVALHLGNYGGFGLYGNCNFALWAAWNRSLTLEEILTLQRDPWFALRPPIQLGPTKRIFSLLSPTTTNRLDPEGLGYLNKQVTVSGTDKLTATHASSTADQMVRALLPETGTVVWYWEFTVNNAGTSNDSGVGFCNASATNPTLGQNASKGAICFRNGSLWFNGSSTATNPLSTFVAGRSYGVAQNLTTNRIYFRDITSGQAWPADPAVGTSGGYAYSGLGGPFYPCATFGSGDTTFSVTFNFGATAFAGTPPTGASSWTPPSTGTTVNAAGAAAAFTAGLLQPRETLTGIGAIVSSATASLGDIIQPGLAGTTTTSTAGAVSEIGLKQLLGAALASAAQNLGAIAFPALAGANIQAQAGALQEAGPAAAGVAMTTAAGLAAQILRITLLGQSIASGVGTFSAQELAAVAGATAAMQVGLGAAQTTVMPGLGALIIAAPGGLAAEELGFLAAAGIQAQAGAWLPTLIDSAFGAAMAAEIGALLGVATAGLGAKAAAGAATLQDVLTKIGFGATTTARAQDVFFTNYTVHFAASAGRVKPFIIPVGTAFDTKIIDLTRSAGFQHGNKTSIYR